MWIRIVPDAMILIGSALILVDIVYKLYLSPKESVSYKTSP